MCIQDIGVDWYYDALESFTHNILVNPENVICLFHLQEIDVIELLEMKPRFTFSSFKISEETGILHFNINLYLLKQNRKGECRYITEQYVIASDEAREYLHIPAISLLYHDKIEADRIARQKRRGLLYHIKKFLKKEF